MFRPLALYIGLRYTRAKKRNHFISFISLASVLGIALGVTVLITVLSVMNGFDYEIHNRIFSLARQLTVSSYVGGIENWQSLQQEVGNNQEIIATAPYASGQAMLAKGGSVRAAMISGIIPEQEANISNIPKMIIQGSMVALRPGEFGIVLGNEIALSLGVTVGDKIIVITPQANMSPIGIQPRFKQFKVVGVFRVGEGFGYDGMMAFIHLRDAQKLFLLGNTITGLNAKITDLYRAPLITAKLTAQLHDNYIVSNWTNEYGQYFRAIQMEKTMMFVILLFIIAVAAFNLVSSLVMMVNDKESDIAILRTIGATPTTIMLIFIVIGGVIGSFGTMLGVVGGIILALNAPALVRILENLFHTHFISAATYFINYLPSKLDWSDVWHIALITVIMSLLATIYPAWRASRIQPAEALRYE